jgi:hypothetical protein
MPIRMTDDPVDPNSRDDDGSGGGGGGRRPGGGGGLPGGGIAALLPLLLQLFKGKGIIVLLILGVGGYFLMNKMGGCGALQEQIQNITNNFSKSGYDYNKDTFAKSSVYEGLDPNNPNQRPLPEAVSLLRYAPDRGNQGQQGSCVAWSCAYAAQTVLTAAATHQDPNQIKFSPSYLYNQIKIEGCQGSYIQRAMESMTKNGGVPLNNFPYNDQTCDNEPSSSDIQKGRQNTIHGFTRLTDGDNVNSINVRAIKEHLANNGPVAIGMMVGQSFMQDMMGQEVWRPTAADESGAGAGGHAMCVIGYDDNKAIGQDASGKTVKGAFQIMNSWGGEWGKNGVAWVGYSDFKNYVREAYGIDPLPKRTEVANLPLECTIGLVNNADKKYIRLRNSGTNEYLTESPIKAGTRFKIEINNVTECYIYIFGQETDGSSYVLFPYLKQGQTVSKHSPYCGITGYRVFPRSESLEADDKGTRDYIAIVVSKDELDYNAVNKAISGSSQSTYAGKVKDALQSMLINSATYNSTANGAIHFSGDARQNKAVATIVAFDKR